MSDLVAIVVPMYNAKKTIKACLRSIQKQTYTNWKAYIVNDGSKDGCDEICRKFGKKDSRIILIDRKNGGSSAARMTGIHQVQDSDYLMFCDSDDTLPENSIEAMLRASKEHDSDLVCGEANRRIRIGAFSFLSGNGKAKELEVYEPDRMMYYLYPSYLGQTGFPPTLWGKLFRTKQALPYFLNREDEAPKFFGDDLFIMVHVLPHMNRCVLIPDAVYNYSIGGGTSKFMKTYLDDTLLMYKLKCKYGEEYNVRPYIRQLTRLELKNCIVSYLKMCRTHEIYPQGSLEAEAKALVENPIVSQGIGELTKEILAQDGTELPGFTQAFWDKDYKKMATIIDDSVGNNSDSFLKIVLRKLLSLIR